MIKKYLLLAVPLFIVLFLFFTWQELQPEKYKYPPPENTPVNPANPPVYKDKESSVFIEGRNLVIHHKQQIYRHKVPLSPKEPASVTVLNNKAPGAPPLMGTEIKKGIKFITESNIDIIQLEPEYKLLLSYPNPLTNGDKIVIDKGNNRLYLYQNGELARYYQVATGKEPHYTPEGSFVITNKSLYPRGRDPDSQLGTRWMGISVPCARDRRAEEDQRAPRGIKYGIHGTNEPDSIGTHASGGCIRMNNKEVEEIYNLVDIGTIVEIVS